MNEKIFTASIELDRKNWNELCYTQGTALRRWIYYAGFPVVFLSLVGLRWFMPQFHIFYCWLFIGITLLVHWRVYRHGQRVTDRNNGKPLYNKITVSDAGIRFLNPYSEKEKDYAYGDFHGAWRSKNLLYLSLDKKQGVCIDLRTVGGGTPEELMAYLLEHSPHWKSRKIHRHFDRRKSAVFLVSLAVIGILTSTGGPFGEPPTMNAMDSAEVLTDLGITGITEEMILEVQKYEEQYSLYNGYNCVTDFLYLAGYGEYDPETWEWTPAESGVYTFDLEAWEVSMMYTDFLTGVAAMSGGELEFTDIVEEDSDVNWEEGTGTKTVSFTFRGERYTLHARMFYDWYDTEFLNEFSRTISRTGEGKKLFYLYDGYQTLSVFYEDASWARQFRKLTGYALSTEIS